MQAGTLHGRHLLSRARPSPAAIDMGCTQIHNHCSTVPLTARARGPSGGRCQATLAGHSDYVLALALAQGAPLLASAGLRGQVCLWDLHAAAQAAGQVRAARPACSGAHWDGQACLSRCIPWSG